MVKSDADRPSTGALRAPACLAADIEGRLTVSERGHDRILVGRSVGSTFEV